MDSLIWLSGGLCHCFDLCGETLELLEQLPGGLVGQHEAGSNNPVYFRNLIPNGLIEANVCERYAYIAVNNSNTDNLGSENLFLMERVF